MSTISLSSFNLNASSNSGTGVSSPIESISDLGEVCGEPLSSQHLLLDFTPDAEIDNEFVQKKICAFWKCINSTPGIKNLMVKPDNRAFSDLSTEETGIKYEPEDDVLDRTAISMLSIIEEKGLITRMFEAKMPQSRCTFDSREYKENQSNTQQKAMERRSSLCTSICAPCPVKKPIPSKGKKLCKKLKDWDTLHPNDNISDTTDETSNPRPLETFSEFGDGSFGEPLYAQQVSIDFTPDAKTDTKFVQKKVCSFWQFINSSPEIQHLKVKSEKNVFTEASDTDNALESVKPKAEVEVDVDVSGEKTAIDMLEFAEEKNLLDRIFTAKLPSKCSLGSPEYNEGEVFTQPKKKEKKKLVSTSTTTNSRYLKNAAQNDKKVLNDQLSCNEINEWDAKHPKSMDPPGHALSLQHCIIQRQVFL